MSLINGTQVSLIDTCCSELNVSGSLIGGDLHTHPARGAISIQGPGRNNLISGTHIQGKTDIDDDANVQFHGCILQ